MIDFVFILMWIILLLVVAYYTIRQAIAEGVRTDVPRRSHCVKCGRSLPDGDVEECPYCGATLLLDPELVVIYREPRTKKEMVTYGILLFILGGFVSAMGVLGSDVDGYLIIGIGVFLTCLGFFLVLYQPIKSKETLASGKLFFGLLFLLLGLVLSRMNLYGSAQTDMVMVVLIVISLGIVLLFWGFLDFTSARK